MNDDATRIVQRLGLAPLPHEGGFFRRIWTAPAPARGTRPAASAIFFLLTDSDFSALHRLSSEELWFFHAGDPIEHIQLIPGQPDPVLTTLHSALNSPATSTPPRSRSPLSRGMPEGRGVSPEEQGASFTLTLPPNVWQGARLLPSAAPSPHGWSLVSCVVAPAWDDADFTLGDRAALLREFPSARDWIVALTR